MPLKKDGCLRSGQLEIKLNKKGIGFISQTPWIQCDTIKNNILFGKSYEYKFYNEVIEVCELKRDFEVCSFIHYVLFAI
jgi:ABC-type multidrug transport system fused ATPase/permease subunit